LPTNQPTAPTITAWLIEKIAAQLKLPASHINPNEPFANYGLDSLQAVSLAGDLETWLDRDLPPTLIWDYPTITTLAAHLAQTPNLQSPISNPQSLIAAPQTTKIALIGLSCRFPHAPNPAAFWQLLANGVDGISEVPPDRWDADAFYAADGAPGKMNTRWGGFLDQVDQF
ncbi:MAG: hypothetical protein KDE56_34235, partial [Anaerolineales bacterium]|nr:hypothetical protein [Anaerolineales bacterium]